MTPLHTFLIPFLFTSAGATEVPLLPSLDQSTLTVRDDCLQAIRGLEETDASLIGYRITRITDAYGREEEQGIYHCGARFERMDRSGCLSIGAWTNFARRIKRD